MQLRIGDWPIYALVLAFGQIISANSYQITLLTGEVGQFAEKLYLILVVYLTTSIIWWVLYRRVQAVVTLSLPFVFYGLSFLVIGLAHYTEAASRRGWIQNVWVELYTVASSSGFVFFALNFGDHGSVTVSFWVFRVCVIRSVSRSTSPFSGTGVLVSADVEQLVCRSQVSISVAGKLLPSHSSSPLYPGSSV